MTRSLLNLSIAVCLTGLPALAGPAPTPDGAGAASPVMAYNCEIGGQSEFFSLDVSSDAVSMLAEGVYSIQQNGQSYLIDDTGVQVLAGPNVGKWPCSPAQASGPTPDTSADTEELASLRLLVIELETRVFEAEQEVGLMRSEQQLFQAERDVALDSLAEISSARDQMAADLRVATRERNAVMIERDGATAALTEAEAALAALNAEATANEAALVTTQAALTAALAAQNAAEDLASDLRQQVEDLTAQLAMADAPMDDPAPMAEEAQPEAEESPMLMEEASEEVVEEEPMEEAAPEEEPMAQEVPMAPEFDADAARSAVQSADLSDIAAQALLAAIDQAELNPEMVPEVMARLQGLAVE